MTSKAFHAAGAPQLPNFSFARTTYAAHPVWKGSTRREVKFAPLSKRAAVKIYHHARRFESVTRAKRGGGHGQGAARVINGTISRVGLCVLHTLLFDFLNYKSGRLDPSYEAIAAKAGVSLSSVTRSLRRLRDCGILSWLRRCSESMDDGRYILSQETNAYGIAPASQWKGYRPPPDAPPPDPESWGKAPTVGAVGYLPGDAGGRIQDAANAAPDGLGAAIAAMHRRRPPAV